MRLPVFESIIAMSLLPQAAKRVPVSRSISRPLGSSQPAIGHSAITLLAFESTTAIVFLSSMLMYMRPFPSGTGVSGLPLRGMVATALRDFGSITEALLPWPSMVKTFPEAGS